MAGEVNLFVLYKIIKELTTPFKDTKAFELGLVDEKGKLLKSPKTKKEKEAYSYFYRFIFNIKRLMGKVGLESQFATFAAALFLLKEESNKEYTDGDILDRIMKGMEELKQNPALYEEIAANSSGEGTLGSDTPDWKKKKKGRPKVMNRFISGHKFLRR